MKLTGLFALCIGAALLIGQTRPAGSQINLLAGVKKPEGLIINTAEGYKTVQPDPGFAYIVGDSRAHLMSNYCSSNHQMSETPPRQADGTYLLKIRPNPSSFAVYKNGLRLSTTRYRLIWPESKLLPDRFEVFDATDADEIMVDYFVGWISVN